MVIKEDTEMSKSKKTKITLGINQHNTSLCLCLQWQCCQTERNYCNKHLYNLKNTESYNFEGQNNE